MEDVTVKIDDIYIPAKRRREIDPEWFEGMWCVGLTAGASTPDSVIDAVEEFLNSLDS